MEFTVMCADKPLSLIHIYPVRENVYAIFNESLDGAGDVWIYLIVGEEKAMVIDTGVGLGDLKGLCGKLSGGKELIVVNTHPHIDHAYGNCQFEQVYCHEYAVPQLMAMNLSLIHIYYWQKDESKITRHYEANVDVIEMHMLTEAAQKVSGLQTGDLQLANELGYVNVTQFQGNPDFMIRCV